LVQKIQKSENGEAKNRLNIYFVRQKNITGSKSKNEEKAGANNGFWGVRAG
jgi:hypothetical protein